VRLVNHRAGIRRPAMGAAPRSTDGGLLWLPGRTSAESTLRGLRRSMVCRYNAHPRRTAPRLEFFYLFFTFVFLAILLVYRVFISADRSDRCLHEARRGVALFGSQSASAQFTPTRATASRMDRRARPGRAPRASCLELRARMSGTNKGGDQALTMLGGPLPPREPRSRRFRVKAIDGQEQAPREMIESARFRSRCAALEVSGL